MGWADGLNILLNGRWYFDEPVNLIDDDPQIFWTSGGPLSFTIEFPRELTIREVQLLTRPEAFLERARPNVGSCVTAENQIEAGKRLPALFRIPAVMRFVSVKPMLETIDLVQWLPKLDWIICGGGVFTHRGSSLRSRH